MGFSSLKIRCWLKCCLGVRKLAMGGMQLGPCWSRDCSTKPSFRIFHGDCGHINLKTVRNWTSCRAQADLRSTRGRLCWPFFKCSFYIYFAQVFAPITTEATSCVRVWVRQLLTSVIPRIFYLPPWDFSGAALWNSCRSLVNPCWLMNKPVVQRT